MNLVKKLLTTGLVLIVALALLAFVWLYESGTQSTDEMIEQEQMVLPGFAEERGNISRIILERPGNAVRQEPGSGNGPEKGAVQKIVLEKVKDQQWNITQPVNYPADHYRCQGLLSGLSMLRKIEITEGRFETTAAEGQKLNPADYGLSQPERVRIACFKRGGSAGEEKEVQIAEVLLSTQTIPGGGGTFAALPSRLEKEIYLVDTSLLSEALTPLDGLRNSRLFQQLSYNNVKRALLNRPDKLSILEFERSGMEWILTQPVKDRGRSERIEEVLRGVISLSAGSFVKDGPTTDELASFGLADPGYRITVTDRQDKNTVLLVGERTEAPDTSPEQRPLYAMIEGLQTVVTVDPEFIKEISLETNEYRDNQLVSLQPEKVNRIVINRPGEPAWDIRLSQGDWKFREPAPFDADNTTMVDLIADLKNIPIEDYLPQGFELDETVKGAISVVLYYEPDSGINPEGVLMAPAAKDKVQARRLFLGSDPQQAPFDPGNVFFVPPAAYNRLNQPVNAFRNRDIFSFSRSRATEVRLEFAEGSAQTAQKKGGRWRTVEPPGLTNAGNIEDILWRSSALRAEKLIGEVPAGELRKYGLHEPAVTLTVTAGNKVLELLLGTEDENGVPAKLAGSETVFYLKGGEKSLLSFCKEGLLKKPPRQAESDEGDTQQPVRDEPLTPAEEPAPQAPAKEEVPAGE